MLRTLPPRLMPTVADLVARAIADGDYANDLTPNSDLRLLVAEYADRGVDTWADDNDVLPATVPAYLVLAARAVLLALANALLHQTELADADARSDAIEAGDTDADGAAVAYATYRSAVA